MQCRATLLFLLPAIVLVSPAYPATFEQGSCDMSGAESYLETVGIGPGLPKLDVRYGHFATQDWIVRGAETTFPKGMEELREAPRVKWQQTGKYIDSKYVVLMLDADAGFTGRPKVHWLVVNAQNKASSGHTVFPYEAPVPASEAHRYVVVLFLQLKPGNLGRFVGKRDNWDFEGFMDANRDSMQPIAYNFFRVDANLTPEDEMLALGFGEDEDDFPTT